MNEKNGKVMPIIGIIVAMLLIFLVINGLSMTMKMNSYNDQLQENLDVLIDKNYTIIIQPGLPNETTEQLAILEAQLETLISLVDLTTLENELDNQTDQLETLISLVNLIENELDNQTDQIATLEAQLRTLIYLVNMTIDDESFTIFIANMIFTDVTIDIYIDKVWATTLSAESYMNGSTYIVSYRCQIAEPVPIVMIFSDDPFTEHIFGVADADDDSLFVWYYGLGDLSYEWA